VFHLNRAPEVPAQDSLREACHKGAPIPSRIQIEKEVSLSFEIEGAVGEPPDIPAEEGTEPLSNLPPGKGKQPLLAGKTTETPQGFGVPHQKLSCLQKDILRVRAPEHQVKKSLCLLVRDLRSLPDLLPEQTDLLVHHIAQT
jgi:hypothetical protein